MHGIDCRKEPLIVSSDESNRKTVFSNQRSNPSQMPIPKTSEAMSSGTGENLAVQPPGVPPPFATTMTPPSNLIRPLPLVSEPTSSKLPAHALLPLFSRRDHRWPSYYDDFLIFARRQGMGWQRIATTYFPGKTADACRWRYERLMEKRKSAEISDLKIGTLAKTCAYIRMFVLLAVLLVKAEVCFLVVNEKEAAELKIILVYATWFKIFRKQKPYCASRRRRATFTSDIHDQRTGN